jgi:hypothetical protein
MERSPELAHKNPDTPFGVAVGVNIFARVIVF